jgi:hypothetical protein
MSSVGRSVLGAALLFAGASVAMVASDTRPVAAQSAQTGAAKTAAAPANAAVATQAPQTGTSTAAVVANTAPIADQSQKTNRAGVADKTDRYGGYDPNSTAGVRAFWESQNPY